MTELDARQAWADSQGSKLTELITAPMVRDAAVRKWRTRIWVDGEMCAVTLAQTLTLPPQADPANTPKLYVRLVTSYTRSPYQVAELKLYRDYSVDDVVAFCRLDTVDPQRTEWHDITLYRDDTIEQLLASALNGR